MQTSGFLGADATAAVAFQDPQQTLCMPAMMDRKNFIAICPWKGFSIGIDVLSFRKTKLFKKRFLLLYLILPYILFSYFTIFPILNGKCSVLLPSLFNGEMPHRYFPVSLFYVPGYSKVLKKVKVKAFNSYSQRFWEFYAMRYKHDMTLLCCKCFPVAQGISSLMTLWYLH